jgi:hypothetical protein
VPPKISIFLTKKGEDPEVDSEGKLWAGRIGLARSGIGCGLGIGWTKRS